MNPEPQSREKNVKNFQMWHTENFWRQAVEKTCRFPQLEALSHPAGGGGGGTAPAPRTVPTAARHRTVPPRVRRRLMARRAAGLGTGRTHGWGTTRRARRTDGRGTTRRPRRHLSRGYCGRRGVPAKVVCKIQNLFIICSVSSSVAEPDPNPRDPYVFGHPGDPDPLVRDTDQDPSIIIKQK